MFPGMGYPLVPGYEAVGEIVDAQGAPAILARWPNRLCARRNLLSLARGASFGASASHLVVPSRPRADANRCQGFGENGTSPGALAATAYHARSQMHAPPELIVGHGVLGSAFSPGSSSRQVGAAPTVWEIGCRPPCRCASLRDVIDPASRRSGTITV